MDFYEPWLADQEFILPAQGIKRGHIICQMRGWGYYTGKATLGWSEERAVAEQDRLRDRIISCVNIMAGRNPEALPGVTSALKQAIETFEKNNFHSEAVRELRQPFQKFLGKE